MGQGFAHVSQRFPYLTGKNTVMVVVCTQPPARGLRMLEYDRPTPVGHRSES